MNKTKNEQSRSNAGSMASQKTNEDFNEKQPNLSDPNEKKGSPKTEIPVNSTDDKKHVRRKRSGQ